MVVSARLEEMVEEVKEYDVEGREDDVDVRPEILEYEDDRDDDNEKDDIDVETLRLCCGLCW